jgi:hypothetical protein
MGLLTPNEFGVSMDKLKVAVRQGLIDPKFGELGYQAKRLLERILKITPAHGSDPATQQYKAIRNDVYKLVQVMPVIVMQALEKRTDLQNKRLDGWLHDNNLGVHLRLNAAGWIRTPEQLRAIHRKQYTSRGRVRGFPAGSRYYISPFVLGEYLTRTMNPMAGKAKAGWLAAASRLYVDKIPSYAIRHGLEGGTFIDGRSSSRPFIDVRNRTRWARASGSEAYRVIQNALTYRVRDMEKHFAMTMQGAVKRAGLTG